MRTTILALFTAATIALPTTASAVELIVFEATGVDLAMGQVVNGDAPLQLQAGQQVTLITDDGRTIRIDGPHNGPPLAEESGGSGTTVISALKDMVAPKQASVTTLGVMRDANIGGVKAASEPRKTVRMPDPWAIDITRGGNQCTLTDRPLVLWRPEPGPAGDVTLTLPDRRLRATTSWPAGYDRVRAPEMEVAEGEPMTAEISGKTAEIKLYLIPASVKSEKARAAWAARKGCEQQARAAASTLEL